MAVAGRQCYMTLVMSDNYLPGAMVLGHSLIDASCKKELVALVTLDTLSVDVVDDLKVCCPLYYAAPNASQTIYRLLPVERIANPKPANLFLMGRPDLLF